jgi:hypothetical protein
MEGVQGMRILSIPAKTVIILIEMRTDHHILHSFLSFPTSIPPKELTEARNDLNSKRHSPLKSSNLPKELIR